MLNKTYQLFNHQKEAVKLFKKNKGILACFLKQGLGKTLITIECFKFIRKFQPDVKLLVTCPLSLIEYSSWSEDINNFSDFTYQDLHANYKNIDHNVDIYLTNFEMFRSKEKLEVIKNLLTDHKFMWVIDESSFLKSNTALQTKRILSLRHLPLYKMCLSGTPAPNSALEFWAQITFLKDGVFPAKFSDFKAEYSSFMRGDQTIPNEFLTALHDIDIKRQVINIMFPTIGDSKRKVLMASNFRTMLMKVNQSGFTAQVSDSQKERLLDKIKPFTIFYKKSDCTDIKFTDQTFIPKMIKMSKEQQDVYNEMKRHMIIEINSEAIVANMAMTKIMKLRQITSGFVYGDECHHMPKNAKLEMLKYDIERFGHEQLIVWCNFTQEIELVSKVLGSLSGCVYGGARKSDKQQTIEYFKSGKLQYLIANPQSISHGLTLTNCAYQIYYSLTDSYERMDQSKDRIHRISQNRDCVYYYYICKGTVDELIWDNINNKQSAEDFVHKFLNS